MKQKLFSMLALLLMAATGAWAQSYTVTLKSGTEDAENWTISAGTDKSADGTTGLSGLSGDGTETVTITYNGSKRIKNITAEKVAEAAVPEGAINGKFTVSASGDQVYFSKGNLKYDGSAWSFFDNQYDYLTTHDGTNWDKFGWSTSTTTYGMSTSQSSSAYSGDFVDWGATMGTGWRTLTSDEWKYLFNTRSASTVDGTANARYAKAKVNNVQGVILFPDTYTHPSDVTAPTDINETGDAGWYGNTYDATAWAKMESAGCVFLPAAGIRVGSSVDDAGSCGDYWSGTANGTSGAHDMYFDSDDLYPASYNSSYYGFSVRLVCAAE